jgi:hypothetical protein
VKAFENGLPKQLNSLGLDGFSGVVLGLGQLLLERGVVLHDPALELHKLVVLDPGNVTTVSRVTRFFVQKSNQNLTPTISRQI